MSALDERTLAQGVMESIQRTTPGHRSHHKRSPLPVAIGWLAVAALFILLLATCGATGA